jgi:hypothetical protein
MSREFFDFLPLHPLFSAAKEKKIKTEGVLALLFYIPYYEGGRPINHLNEHNSLTARAREYTMARLNNYG